MDDVDWYEFYKDERNREPAGPAEFRKEGSAIVAIPRPDPETECSIYMHSGFCPDAACEHRCAHPLVVADGD